MCFQEIPPSCGTSRQISRMTKPQCILGPMTRSCELFGLDWWSTSVLFPISLVYSLLCFPFPTLYVCLDEQIVLIMSPSGTALWLDEYTRWSAYDLGMIVGENWEKEECVCRYRLHFHASQPQLLFKSRSDCLQIHTEKKCELSEHPEHLHMFVG